MNGTFFQVNVLPFTTLDNGATEWSTSGSLVDVSQGQKTALKLYRMWHSSTHPPNVLVRHCTWQVLPGLPLH